MKKIIAIACMAWMALTGIYAGNISVEDVQMQAGETKTVSISLTNTTNTLVGFQMDLTLPEGIGINKAGCQLSSRFGDPDQALTIGKQGDNVYRLTSTSFALTPISGTSGTIITLSLTASETTQGGTATLSDILFATSASGSVTMSTATFNITVQPPRVEQTLALESLPAMTYGDAAYTLPATTAEGLTLTWTSGNIAVATISGNTLTVGNAGTATITATQAGNDSYLPFSREFSLTVGKAVLTITANDCTKVEGDENPELTISYEGFKNGDTEAVLIQQPTVTTTATTNSPAGTYPITVSGAEAANYDISYVAGTLTVTEKATQTLALESLPAMTYGDATYTLPETTEEGFTLTWTSSHTAVAIVSGNVLTVKGTGTATITATQAGNGDYKAFSREFSLTVGKAALTITANDCTKVEGEENPELTVSYEGFKYDDNASVLTQQPTVTTEATTDSPAGTYPITVTGAEAANYDISYVAGTLTVEEAKIEPTDISQLDNAIYVDPVETVSNSTYALNIKAKNNVTVAGMSFTLTLPDDFSLITDDGGIISTLDSQRASSSKFMVMSSQSGNSYLIRVLPISGTTISGTDGTVLTVRLKNTNAEEGTYELKVNNSSFTVKNADNTFETLPLVDVISTIEITGKLLGDVNGDGNVDLTDAIMIVNHSLDNTPSNFRIDVADVNGDGNIDLTDAIIVVNMSMDSSSMARQAFMMDLDPE